VQNNDEYQENEEKIILKYNIIIIGAGGFGREVYVWAKESFSNNQYKIKGFIDDNNNALDDYNLDIGIIGSIDGYMPDKQDRFLIAIGNVNTKKSIITKLKEKGIKYINLIHPSAIIFDTARIGIGVIICPLCIISDHVKIDDFVIINSYSTCGHDARIGKYCTLSSFAAVNGFGVLENEVFLGTHSTVIPGKKVGYKSKVSANSVVMRDVPANKIVFGVPGKAI
jgi:sugar O-acyltransferase (sialic acid O-acetyltransferase NeuD family)